ncbi:MAG: hypothetical protein QOE14_627 [Humisphaera sp.]|nr:hypothetical protein [Humisphaera sp.]
MASNDRASEESGPTADALPATTSTQLNYRNVAEDVAATGKRTRRIVIQSALGFFLGVATCTALIFYLVGHYNLVTSSWGGMQGPHLWVARGTVVLVVVAEVWWAAWLWRRRRWRPLLPGLLLGLGLGALPLGVCFMSISGSI